MVTATIQDGSQITATDHHLCWNETDQAWTELDQIQPGDHLLSPNGPVEVLILDVADVTNTLVWELTVATDHNFTVNTGAADVLVHNCSVSQRFRTSRVTQKCEVGTWRPRNGAGVTSHFDKHGDDVGASSRREYDLGARETIQNGRRFTYRDRRTGEPA